MSLYGHKENFPRVCDGQLWMELFGDPEEPLSTAVKEAPPQAGAEEILAVVVASTPVIEDSQT